MPKTKRPKSTPGVCRCPFADAAVAHHDSLRRVEHDLDALLNLLELAVTWHELDYSDEAIVPPCDWTKFAAVHSWQDPLAAKRIFGLAVDIWRGRASRSPATPGELSSVGPAPITIRPDPMDLGLSIIRLEHDVDAIADFVGVDLSLGEDHR